MSDRLYGEITSHPWLTVTVEARHGTQEIKFLVDTGFDGELAVPRSMTGLFGISNDFLELAFADGVHANSPLVQCRVEWLGGYREVTAIYIDGNNPLLGVELLEGCLVTLEIRSGQGEMTIEAL